MIVVRLRLAFVCSHQLCLLSYSQPERVMLVGSRQGSRQLVVPAHHVQHLSVSAG
jgi:hypothetical protein